MKQFFFALAMILPATFISFPLPVVAQTFDYPTAKRGEQMDDYFGTTVADPYRWMETNDTPELTAWIDAENKSTAKYLDSIPLRDELKKRLTEIVDYPKYSLPWKKAGKLFYFQNSGLQNQSVLYVIDEYKGKIDGARELLDPNKLSDDGTVALQNVEVSKDGKYLAYSISRSGSDWNEINVLKIDGNEKLADRIEWVKFSGIAWYGNGFYYSAYDAPKGDALTTKNEYHKIFYHKLGTAQKDDVLIREDKNNPLRTRQASTDKDEKYLFITESDSTYGNSLFFKDLSKADNPLQCAVDDFTSEIGIIEVLDGKFYALTDRNASNKRLVLIDPAKAQPEHWKDVITQTENLLKNVHCFGGQFFVTYLKDAADAVYQYSIEGKQQGEFPLPTLGVAGFSGDKDEKEFFYSFTSFLYPSVIYRANVHAPGNESVVIFPSAVNFKTDDYQTERVFYTNSAGKKVPIFLTYKKGLKKDGSNPTLLYGYGGFNISMTPNFSPYRLPFLEKGGIYAHTVLRGGGEYGDDWHKAGTKLQKQNVFDDFAAAAEFLIKEKYTSPEKLAVNGGSNGGLLVGASVTQRPDLFKASVAQVGVLDMLRYHKFTIGWAWATDYGTSEESKEMFEYLLKYSPLHNVQAGVNYPATLVMTSDHDDRVVPAHSFKFTAEMQSKSTSKNPVYIRIETKAGHGAGKPISKRIDEQADIWTFLCNQLGMK
ncbi:MAG: prolyl oligopeptidase family serine peptidase [Planctomycetaceae bacterium]|jgi:prolyl oligopeptidase|nr:prolyl oligopeptidase family serine peptidase [Planctomycetaceae bacterium]